MKRKQRIIIVAYGILGVSILAILVTRYGLLSPGIAYHNSVLEQCISVNAHIQIKCKDADNPDTFSKIVAVTDKERAEWLLKRLRITKAPKDRLNHACRGHLVITIKTSDNTYNVQYDHGDGIYPISDGTHYVGFVHLKRSVCSQLNDYFRSLGFTDMELGIPPG